MSPVQNTDTGDGFQYYLVPLFQNESSCKTCHENEFDLHETDPAGGTYFPVDGFARRLVMT